MADLSDNATVRYALSPRAAVDAALGQVGGAVSSASAQTFGGNNAAGSISFSPVSVVKTGEGSWQMGGGLNFDIPMATVQQFSNQAMNFSAANSAANRAGIGAISASSEKGVQKTFASALSSLLGIFDANNSTLAQTAESGRGYLAGAASTVDGTLNSVSQRAMGLTGTALGASERIAMMNAQVAQNTANQMFETVRFQEAQTTERTRIEMQNQGGGGGMCFLTTAVCEHWGLDDNCYYLSVLRKFRDQVMTISPSWKPLIDQYKAEAPAIVEGISRRDDKGKIWEFVGQEYIIPAVEFVESCDYESAIKVYRQMFTLLKGIAQGEV